MAEHPQEPEEQSRETVWGEWMQKLLAWQKDAAIGDNGEKPTWDIEFDGWWWYVSAQSFYDGHANANSNKSLEDAAREVVERLTSHPERQREAEINAAVSALTRASGYRMTTEQARHVVRQALADQAPPHGRS